MTTAPASPPAAEPRGGEARAKRALEGDPHPGPAAIGSMAGPFRRRTLFALIAVGVVSLVVGLVLAIFADDFAEEKSADTTGFSTSAIGYQALIQVLRELDVPVSLSRTRSASRAGEGLLVIAAPDLDDDAARDRFEAMVESSRRVLVILPRWWGVPAADKPKWIAARHELPVETAAEVLEVLGLAGVVLREDGQQLLAEHDLDVEEEGGDAGDLLVSTWYDRDTRLWVLADPSRLDNVGLRARRNVHWAVGLIEYLREGGPVVFDETLHGFEKNPSLYRSLFTFPLVLVSMQVIVCALLLLWAATGRWGPPRAAAAPLPSGKDFLIRNTAALLHVGGHDADALRRYLATTIHAVRVALHAPRELDPAALRTWLERVRASRGGAISILELEREVDDVARARRSGATSRRTVELAARIHRWRTEMTHGPHHHQ